MNGPMPRLVRGKFGSLRAKVKPSGVPYPSPYRRQYARPPVNQNPQTPLEWQLFWQWHKWHWLGVKNWCERMKRKERHAFTHMGLEDD